MHHSKNMIKKYKSFTIFKRKEVTSEKAPGYDALASIQNPDGTYEKSVNIGGVWLREGRDGSKFFSGKLSDTRTYEGSTFAGFCIVSEVELNKLIELAQAMVQKTNSPLKDGYPTEVEKGVPYVSDIEPNPEDIPF